MNFDQCIQKIYNKIQDKESKFIFANRLNYSLTHDSNFLQGMIDKTVRNRKEWIDLCNCLAKLSLDEELMIFGAGIWGSILCSETKNRGIRWKGIIDSNPVKSMLYDVPVIAFDDFVKEYKGEYIVISSYKLGNEMQNQLQRHGISKDKIIDAGSVIYELTEKAIYFDLNALLPLREREVFVDAGCFDGLNTRLFFDWCNGNGYSYCFEPDDKNIGVIRNVLKEYKNYEVIHRALWSKTGLLAINAMGNYASFVADFDDETDMAKIEAVALDDFLMDKKITFIKMDIEGAELEAIKGAKKIIGMQKPRLAISVYHKFQDIWMIPDELLKYYSNYRFYLRHYSFSDYDTVLYAIP